MKDIILVVICVIVLMLCGCRNVSHNFSLIGDGTYFEAGFEACKIRYMSGTFASNIVRENTKTSVTTKRNDTLANPGEMQGETTITFETGQQVTGYLVDLAKQDPEAVKIYLEKYNKTNKEQESK